MNTAIQNSIWHDITAPLVSVKADRCLQQIIVLEKSMPETALTFSLDGVRASLDCVIIILADDAVIPLDIRILHNAPYTNAKVAVRSVARNRARVTINGVLQCMEGSDESTTHFSHHALHLSDDVQTRTIPSLEIKADGVMAKHEVSIGYFDAQALWYGQTRGVSKETMINEMAKGFAIKDLSALSGAGDISSVLESVERFMIHV